MSVPFELLTIEGRQATFEQPQQLAKRRASTTKKKTANTVTWPHTNPSPETLARAGFYYKPTATSHDSVTCFLCNKSLDGWDPEDNPALEHLAHVPHCGWAINICIEQRSQDMDRVEEDPMNEKMVEARKATFQDAWPHEGKRGWKCQTKKMVEAGWCYNPLLGTDDCVACFYCGVSLDGWEPKDDPWQEHQKRAPACHFFTLVEESSKLKKSTKGKQKRNSRASKASRLSTQSTISVASDVPSLTSLDDAAAEGDTVLTTASTTSKAGKGKKKGAKTKANSKKTQQSKQEPDESMIDTTQMDSTMLDDIDTTTYSTAAAPRTTRAKGGKKGKRATDQMVNESVIDLTSEALDTAVKPQTKTRGKKKQAEPREEVQEFEAPVEALQDQAKPQAETRSTRGKKRKSDGSEKVEESVVAEQDAPCKKVAAKTAKKGKGAKKDTALQGETEASEMIPEEQAEESQPKPTKKSAAKSQKKKPTAKHSKKKHEEVIDEGEEEEGETVESKDVIQDATELDQTAVTDEIQRVVNDAGGKEDKAMTLLPSPSAQSSDAENQPPSSRPSFNAGLCALQSEQAIRQPLADTTPIASPTRRNVIAGGLASTVPWKAVDLEKVFLASPSWRQIGDKENMVVVEEVLGRLPSPQKGMSVEEWIMFNAKGAEERLRDECERLIGIFEGEGVRAIQTLEGVECA